MSAYSSEYLYVELFLTFFVMGRLYNFSLLVSALGTTCLLKTGHMINHCLLIWAVLYIFKAKQKRWLQYKLLL